MKISNPASTGHAGVSFETKVSAACLAILLTRGTPPFLGMTSLWAVHLQAGHLDQGWNTDDLLLEGIDEAGTTKKAALQVKRTFSISESDEESVKTLRGALSDFRNTHQFTPGQDIIAVVTSSLSAKLARGLRTLLDCARASISADDMERRMAIPGYLGKQVLGYYGKIKIILSEAEGCAPSNEEIWGFLRHFHISDMDLDVDGGTTEILLKSLLGATTADGDTSSADNTWHRLASLALTEAGKAASFTREELPTELLARHTVNTDLTRGVSQLLEDTNIVLDGIQTTIAGTTEIKRRELTGKLMSSIENSALIFVTGEAGVGKSALVKSAFNTAVKGGIGFSFRADSLAASHINDVLRRRDMTLRKLQAQTAMIQKKVLWVDSLERLLEKPPNERVAFLDLLQALKTDPSWRIVVTCRDYSAETVRAAFFGELGLEHHEIEVGMLSDDELADAILKIPALERPMRSLFLRKLFQNPFYLDKGARMDWPADAPLPLNERAFREKVWNEVIQRNDEDMETGMPVTRAQTMVEVSLRRAKALVPFVPATDLEPRALARLVRDSLLSQPTAGSSSYSPAHDVFEDWALMRWLEEMFPHHGNKLDALLDEIGTYPALRRAYRGWLTESLNIDPSTTDSIILDLIVNPDVAAHWREDTLVAVLQSDDAAGFLTRNKDFLLGNNAELLRVIIHILRVACRAVIPAHKLGIHKGRDFFFPKGQGWLAAASLLEEAIPSFTEMDLMFIINYLEDWVFLTRFGINYPKGAGSIARLAWHWIPRIPWRCPVDNAQSRLFQIILSVPLAAEAELTEKVFKIITTDRAGYRDGELLKLICSHFSGHAIFRDMPDLAFQVAGHLYQVDSQDVKPRGVFDSYRPRELEDAFGLGERQFMDDFPASAYQGPFLQMLWNHPARGIEFILTLINRAVEAYANPDTHHQYIEHPGEVTIQLPDGPHTLFSSWRLWTAYRGISVTPDCFQSALMALERWLLDKSQQQDPDLDSILLDLLRRSNNVAIAAVVASISVYRTDLSKEAAFALLTCPSFLKMDLERSASETMHSAAVQGLNTGLPPLSAENSLCEKERTDSSNLEHRSQSLEFAAIKLQFIDDYRERVWELIDSFKKALPPPKEQNEEEKLWRIQLHRIDTRNFGEAGRTEDGKILIGSGKPEPDLQELIDQIKPQTTNFESAVALYMWGTKVFRRELDGSDWREQIDNAKKLTETITEVGDRTETIAHSAPVIVATVCVRDNWEEMLEQEQEWCSTLILDSVDAQANTSDYLTIASCNSMDGSRFAAFILPSLLGKNHSEGVRSRLMTSLANAVLHAVDEMVGYTVQGIASFLWQRDRGLGLTCLHALAQNAIFIDQFREKQRQIDFDKQESEETFRHKLRSRMREFIVNGEAGDEGLIVSLDLSRWPGRSVAKHLFTIAIWNPDDPLLRQVMRICAGQIPLIWEGVERGRNIPEEGECKSYDHQIGHDFTEALARYAIKLNSDAANELFLPIFSAAMQYPKHSAGLITQLIISQGDREESSSFWRLWQQFADDFVKSLGTEEISDKFNGASKLLQELMLNISGCEISDWEPLRNETQKIRSFFHSLPATIEVVSSYSYYLAHLGSSTLPDALSDISVKLEENKRQNLLSETAVYHLETILTRLIYAGDSRIRGDERLRHATLTVLDALVASGSSAAFKLRDDFLTPLR